MIYIKIYHIVATVVYWCPSGLGPSRSALSLSLSPPRRRHILYAHALIYHTTPSGGADRGHIYIYIYTTPKPATMFSLPPPPSADVLRRKEEGRTRVRT